MIRNIFCADGCGIKVAILEDNGRRPLPFMYVTGHEPVVAPAKLSDQRLEDLRSALTTTVTKENFQELIDIMLGRPASSGGSGLPVIGR